jgi:ferredoxin
MKPVFFKSKIIKTSFIIVDIKKCKGCWNCLKICKNNVIGRINLTWHKHIILANVNLCVGCLKCVKVCKTGAITALISMEK